jgi:hypothetical protein
MNVRRPFGDSMAVAVELMIEGLTTCEFSVLPSMCCGEWLLENLGLLSLNIEQ